MPVSKKTQIAKLILSMTRDERRAMADDFVSMQRAAADDGSEWPLNTLTDWSQMLRSWAGGLGGME